MRLAYLYPGRESDKDVYPEYFETLERVIKTVVRADTSFEIRGLSDDVPEETEEELYWYIRMRYYSEVVAAAKKAEVDGFDAVVIGSVGATEAEYAIKEALSIPVAGISESCLYLAQLLGHNFALLLWDKKTAAWLDRVIREFGLQDKCVSIRIAEITLDDVFRASMDTYERMLEQAKKAVDEDHAEVLVTASAGFVGVNEYLRKHMSVPIVNPVEAGVKFAEMLVDLKKAVNIGHSKIASFKSSPNTEKVLKITFPKIWKTQ